MRGSGLSRGWGQGHREKARRRGLVLSTVHCFGCIYGLLRSLTSSTRAMRFLFDGRFLCGKQGGVINTWTSWGRQRATLENGVWRLKGSWQEAAASVDATGVPGSSPGTRSFWLTTPCPSCAGGCSPYRHSPSKFAAGRRNMQPAAL